MLSTTDQFSNLERRKATARRKAYFIDVTLIHYLANAKASDAKRTDKIGQTIIITYSTVTILKVFIRRIGHDYHHPPIITNTHTESATSYQKL